MNNQESKATDTVPTPKKQTRALPRCIYDDKNAKRFIIDLGRGGKRYRSCVRYSACDKFVALNKAICKRDALIEIGEYNKRNKTHKLKLTDVYDEAVFTEPVKNYQS